MAIGRPGGAARRQIRELLDELEPRVVPSLALWPREALMLRLRGVAALLAGLEGADDLRARYTALEEQLRAIDRREFEPIHQAIAERNYDGQALSRDLSRIPPHAWDPFVLRVLGIERPPAREEQRGAEMVDYVATSVHSVLELASELGAEDLLVDLGAGLGLVVLLAAWLTPARALGIEIEPAFVRYAEARARAMHLDRARFVTGDVCLADYEGANVFYLYYPARGAMLARLIERLRAEAQARPIRVYSTGLSTAALGEQPWLEPVRPFPSGMVSFRGR